MDEKEAEARPVMGTIFLVITASLNIIKFHGTFIMSLILNSQNKWTLILA